MMLFWILGSGLAMAAIALVGVFSVLIKADTLQKMLLPLVAFAAGALLGGAYFHMLPQAVRVISDAMDVWNYLVLGFLFFFILEQFLHWHHSHHLSQQKPLTHLILLADALHNFIGGASVSAAFILDIRLGITAWLAAAAHELPQELGDFAVLVHGGWSKRRALLFNFISALTFPLGGLVTYFLSHHINFEFLIPFAAGNFIYIASADLIPEIKSTKSMRQALIHLLYFVLGLGVLWSIRYLHL